MPRADHPRPIRVVIAYDMSIDADRAVAIVAGVRWPPGSIVRIVTSSSGIGTGLSSFAAPGQLKAHRRELHAAITAAHEHVAARLAATGASLETAIVTGRPGAAVVRAARTANADLIVVGARSQSPLEATVLGSVSTEISERAGRPVLIVRVESFERVVLATDASPAAAAAAELVARLPFLAMSEIRVLQVVPPDMHAAGLLLPADDVAELYRDAFSEARVRAREHITLVAERLVESGLRADAHLRPGTPAEEIAAAVRDWPADIVVLGSTGKSMIRRLILGSVARSVAQGVQASVLLVPPPVKADAGAA